MEYAGLTTEQVSELLKKNGPNEIPTKHDSKLKKLLKLLFSPISFMLLAAAILSYVTGKVFDFYFIIALIFLNSGISFWQESKADNAIKKLNEHLASQVKVFRDKKWQQIDSRSIVPGDVVEISVGGVLPADGQMLEASNLSINESALTGESLPKEKNKNDKAFSGSFVATGKGILQITATGRNTYFGKTLSSIEKTKKKSILEQDIVRISKFLSIFSIVAIGILSLVFVYQKVSWADLLTLDLSLLIAGVPISLPTVMTLIIELGVVSLAAKKVIVRRLSALEDLANVNLLLTDKTGTLTQNKIEVQKIVTFQDAQEKDVLYYAWIASKNDDSNTINQTIVEKATQEKVVKEDYKLLHFTPPDSVRKRSTTLIEKNGKKLVISVGAPQIIEKISRLETGKKGIYQGKVSALANEGYRALSVALSQTGEEKDMKMVGILALSDVLRPETPEVIHFMNENGIHVVMLTGDHKAISQEVIKRLKFGHQHVLSREEINWDHVTEKTFADTGAFAEILPDDKLHLAKLAKQYAVVAVTGDGVNDLPAIKEANVGIAVKNAVDALKSTADIVLLSNGISVIKDSIIESRKIFSRIYSYSMYRISESLRLIITIAILGILYRIYPLTALQIILIALLNDIPIISLAFDTVKQTLSPSKINVKGRFVLSSLFALTGIGNSLILFFIMTTFSHLSWNEIQTVYFLKLTVSGHMLIYVARTRERWFRFLPAKQVILATTITQLIATSLALTGLFMPSRIPIFWVVIVWVWSFMWMQVAEIFKSTYNKYFDKEPSTTPSIA